jgi:putative spermidine/putrescine transport system permease protein
VQTPWGRLAVSNHRPRCLCGGVAGAGGRRARIGPRRRLSAALWRRPWVKATALLAPPLAWLVLIYLAALAALLISGFWTSDFFTGQIKHTWNLDNFRQIFSLSDTTYIRIAWTTIWVAALVTALDAVIAFPIAYYMARVASSRTRAILFVLVLLPLWSSYIVRVYAWRVILKESGVLNWALNGVGLPDANLAFTRTSMVLVFSYVWLPFMILPVFAALERIPDSYLEASGDLGARGFRTLRSVILPLALPGLVAGSIFTFSLTLGDYLTPILIGGANAQFIGNVVFSNVGVANNIPFAAAYATVPVIVVAVYLVIARRLGAFEAL